MIQAPKTALSPRTVPPSLRQVLGDARLKTARGSAMLLVSGSTVRTPGMKDILEAASSEKNAPEGSPDQIIGDYYGACMDESRVNARGMEPVKPWFAKIDAARALMRHVLFFAEERELVARVFDSVLAFVSRVEVAQLIFTPDARAWELVR